MLLMVFLVACAGCAAQKNTNFMFTPTGELIAVGDKSQVLSDGELVGEHCTIELKDGTVLKGIILAASPVDLSLGRDKDSAAMEDVNAVAETVHKNEIGSLTLIQEKEPGFSVGDMSVALVLIPVALLFWFVTTYEGGWN